MVVYMPSSDVTIVMARSTCYNISRWTIIARGMSSTIKLYKNGKLLMSFSFSFRFVSFRLFCVEFTVQFSRIQVVNPSFCVEGQFFFLSKTMRENVSDKELIRSYVSLLLLR